MEVELSAPNGRKWSQPLGLFINNEFVPSSNGQKLATINAVYDDSTLPSRSGQSDMYNARVLKRTAWQYRGRNMLRLRRHGG